MFKNLQQPPPFFLYFLLHRSLSLQTRLNNAHREGITDLLPPHYHLPLNPLDLCIQRLKQILRDAELRGSQRQPGDEGEERCLVITDEDNNRGYGD